MRDIESSGSHIGSNETLEFTLFEGGKGDFSLLLRDVAMQDLTLEVDVRVQHDLVAFFLGLGKDDRAVALLASVAENDVADGGDAVVVVAGHGQMLHVQGSLIV